MIRDLLHADRVLRLMGLGLSFTQARRLPDDEAELLIEAAEIACDGEDECDTVILIGGPPDA